MNPEGNGLEEEETQQNSITEFGKSLFNAVFMTLCRPFNSREVSVVKSSSFQQKKYYKYEQFGSSGMLLMTENFLRGNMIQTLLGQTSKVILMTVEEYYRISHDSAYYLIAADICRYFARKAKNSEQIGYHLSALRYCYLVHMELKKMQNDSEEKKFHDNCLFLQEIQIANEAIAGIFSYLKEKALTDSDMFSMNGIDGSRFIMKKPVFRLPVPREAVSDFSLCSDYSIKALRLINRHSGFGVPLVAKVTAAELSKSLRIPPGLTIPVTVFFRIRQDSDRVFSVTPEYQDTSLNETFMETAQENNIRRILARDYTTPLACFMNDITQRNLLSGMLHPVVYDTLTGLYMVEPYNPEKIPVVFVHGLMSSPETWGQMINSLKYDRKIRQNYQFWFFCYSTGVPVVYSAKKLRNALLEAQKEYCTSPAARQKFEQMVLVGHSMGGLVIRLLLQKYPDQIIRHYTRQTWEEIRKKLSPEDQNLVEEDLLQPSIPFVKRAVFMSVPHRGAAMAKRILARLGIRLIRLPKSITSKTGSYQRIIKTIFPDFKNHWYKNVFITGIDNLDPDSIFVQWAGQSPLKEDVVYHSIIGNQKEDAVPGGSDGVVPYSSSHLNGIASECIVKSDHSVHRRPAAIRELMRILLLHINEKN